MNNLSPEMEAQMPVHPEDKRQIKGCPASVPMAILNEQQAQSNHGQSLSRLAERGGLSIREMLAVINRKSWSYYAPYSDEKALETINTALAEYRGKKEGEDE